MITYEFWRDTRTGLVWAVRLIDGVVEAACGPLDAEDTDEAFLPSLDYTTAPAAAMDRERDSYTTYEPARAIVA